MTAPRRRVRLRVEGTVQGVGFRPHVHRLATDLGLAGFVLNDAAGVVVEVESDSAAVDRFLERLGAEAPALARIDRVLPQELPAVGDRGFAILLSDAAGDVSAGVPADAATCADCLRELRDPADRRYRYPFVNCTACGPRYTIVTGVPYDRARTTMAAFPMCDACRAEYEDPADRRFHAEPIACPDCGPRLSQPLDIAVDALIGGRIVAVKGIGGYHLACLAHDEAAVARLRGRKRREEKPFAVMAPDVAAAGALVDLTGAERVLLEGRERPIVLARRRPGAAVAPSVAPRSADLGVMLPYSPIHHLLLGDVGAPLVMTSGNRSDEPIAHEDADAARRLAGIADLIVGHDRPIATRVDDSVVRAVPGRAPLVMRRSRGWAPSPLALPVPAPRHILACGAELKSTACVAKDARAWVSHHVGDLGDWETLRAYRATVAHLERLFAVRTEIVAHDMHPDYRSTAYALERDGAARVAVQHHHAHLAACLAEHGETGPAAAAILDGAGYGTDGTIWGGEILVGDIRGFRRAAHLRPVRLPGGDAAVREPWRMACAWLAEATGAETPDVPVALDGRVDAAAWRAVARLARAPRSPVTSSAGRLLDAVAALCGLRVRVTYEGQAAVELEAACDPSERGAYPWDGLDPRPAVAAAAGDLAAGVPVGVVAARTHAGLACAVAGACTDAAAAAGVGLAVLSGGVFQNRLLLGDVATRLDAAGLRVLVPERLPPNDGGISYGQAAVAAASDGGETGP